MLLRSLATAACCTLLATASFVPVSAQMGDTKMGKPTAPLASPDATAEVSLGGKQVSLHYNSPRLKGRKIGSEVAPYGTIWRTGANTATMFMTAGNLKIGTLDVPAGTYTIYTLPNADQWLLIVNKQTGQWGTKYDESQDLGRVPMKARTLPASQENMSLSFEHTKGSSTELHIKWGTTDEYVSVQAQ